MTSLIPAKMKLITGLILFLIFLPSSNFANANESLLFTGALSAYAKWPTLGTIAYRQERGELPTDLSQFDVLLAVPNCSLIGHPGTMVVNEHVLRVIVFDCAGTDGHDWMITNGIAAEIDYNSWITHPEWVGNRDVTAVVQIHPERFLSRVEEGNAIEETNIVQEEIIVEQNNTTPEPQPKPESEPLPTPIPVRRAKLTIGKNVD